MNEGSIKRKTTHLEPESKAQFEHAHEKRKNVAKK